MVVETMTTLLRLWLPLDVVAVILAIRATEWRTAAMTNRRRAAAEDVAVGDVNGTMTVAKFSHCPENGLLCDI